MCLNEEPTLGNATNEQRMDFNSWQVPIIHIHIQYARKRGKSKTQIKQISWNLCGIPLMKLINSCWWWLSFSYVHFNWIRHYSRQTKNNIIAQKTQCNCFVLHQVLFFFFLFIYVRFISLAVEIHDSKEQQ